MAISVPITKCAIVSTSFPDKMIHLAWISNLRSYKQNLFSSKRFQPSRTWLIFNEFHSEIYTWEIQHQTLVRFICLKNATRKFVMRLVKKTVELSTNELSGPQFSAPAGHDPREPSPFHLVTSNLTVLPSVTVTIRRGVKQRTNGARFVSVIWVGRMI